MKINKTTAFMVIVIIFGPYFYNKNVENNIWNKTFKQCKKMNNPECSKLEKKHRECFELSYRFKFRSMNFYEDEYNFCMKK